VESPGALLARPCLFGDFMVQSKKDKNYRRLETVTELCIKGGDAGAIRREIYAGGTTWVGNGKKPLKGWSSFS